MIKRTKDKIQTSQKCLQPEWDLFQAARATLATIPAVTLTTTHVKSHQDKGSTPLSQLPLSAQLNIQVDQSATAIYQHIPNPSPPPLLPSTIISLYISNSQVTSSLTQSITLAYYTPTLRAKNLAKYGWSTPIFLSIDWESSEKESRRLSYGRSLATFKLQQGLWPTYTVLNQRNPSHPALCPRCNVDPETHDHVLRCTNAHDFRSSQWAEVVSTFKDTLRTPRVLLRAIECGIRSWQDGIAPIQWPYPIPPNSDTLGSSIYNAFLQQTAIGWNHALRGHLSLQWGASMLLYMQQRYPAQPFKPTSWMRKLISSLRAYAYSQWEQRNHKIHGATHEETKTANTLPSRTKSPRPISASIRVYPLVWDAPNPET